MNITTAKLLSELKYSRFERRISRFGREGTSTNTWLKDVTKRFHKATRRAAKKLCAAEVGNPRRIIRLGTYHAV